MQRSRSTVAAWLYRIGGWIFPSLTELQIVLAYGVGLGLLLIRPEALHLLWRLTINAHNDPSVIVVYVLYLIVIVTPLVVIVRKQALSDGMKAFIEMLYFLFVALLALAALSSSQLMGNSALSFAWVNAWVARLAFGFAILRMFLALLAVRTEDAGLERFVSQNFKDTQFRRVAIALTLIIGIGSVLVIQRSYSDVAVIALLGLAYGGAIISLGSKLRLMVVA